MTATLTPLEQRFYDNLKHAPTKAIFKNNCFIKLANADECIIACSDVPTIDKLKRRETFLELCEAAYETLGMMCLARLVVEKRASN